jgi:hypothetical protein
MKDFTIIEYMLDAISRGYLESIQFKETKPNKVCITAYVSKEAYIRPARDMIEANMMINKMYNVINITHNKNKLYMSTENNVSYVITVRYSKTKCVNYYK